MSNFLITGIDGGGTKTECIVSDIEGNLIGKGLAGPSNPRNQGLEVSAGNIVKSFRKAIGRRKGPVSVIFVALAALEEEYAGRTNLIKKELLKDKRILRNAITFVSDQNVAFRAGTDEPDGIVVIAGTGSVVRGWNSGKDVKVSGWGYLADEGSAFWVGRRAYQVIAKELDGRGERTVITKFSGFSDIRELNQKIYQDPSLVVPKLSIAVNNAANQGDGIALAILEEGTNELLTGVATVVEKLGFTNSFPLVVSGGMFKSKTFKALFREKIQKHIPLARFVIPTKSPTFGSLKLAMEKHLATSATVRN